MWQELLWSCHVTEGERQEAGPQDRATVWILRALKGDPCVSGKSTGQLPLRSMRAMLNEKIGVGIGKEERRPLSEIG